ncbi:MAG TPA: glucoamylase family protein [Pseudolabrys sp.]|nr:glucoamylase family protein [Pseudolabrys sp.]
MTSLSDGALLDRVQRQTLRYFVDFAHPVSGLARERSNPVAGYDYRDTVTTGGTGFGVMALIAGAARGFVTRADARAQVATIVDFLASADRFHGVFPHFLHGGTGKTIPFSAKDDGGDLVETSFLMMGLLCARQYFSDDAKLGAAIDRLWHAVEWDWHTRGEDVLYWHWSPRHDWAMNHAIRGWNECLVTYVLAAASPTHAIAPEVYHRGWADSPVFRNGRSFHGIALPLGPDLGGPLFFAHYSFLGLDPRGLSDAYADYWAQNRVHVSINRAHCIANPNRFAGYGENCWGLTACDGDKGYNAFSPTNDRGVIAPTAALSSMPYAPAESLAALRHFHEVMDGRLWRDLGFADAFNETAGWIAEGHLAIDQGPIVVMIENHRSALLWRLFTSCPEIAQGLTRLGFSRRAVA